MTMWGISSSSTRYLALLICFLVLAACGGGSGNSSGGTASAITILGAAQKGPFVINSTVLVNLLTPAGQPTGTTIVTKTTDSVGDFSVGMASAGPIQITAEGYHYNELTGRLSDSTLTLRGIYQVTAESHQLAYVNVLTHLISNRVLKLMGGGMGVGAAIDQAQKELLTALKDVIPAEQISKFTSLSVYDVSGTESSGDAYLLALSATIYQDATDLSMSHGTSVDAELTLLLNTVAVDLEDNGIIDDAAVLSDLQKANTEVVPQDVVRNLQDFGKVAGETLSVPNIDAYTNRVLITAPANGTLLIANTQIKFTAPAVKDAAYRLLVDGEAIDTVTQQPFAFAWNPYFWPAGAHTLLVERVEQGNVTSDSNLVTVYSESSVANSLQPIQPISDAYVASGSDVSLIWQVVPGAKNYEVQLAKDNAFSSIVTAISSTVPNYPLGSLDAGPYFWRFRATDSLGQTGPWSPTIGFGVNVFGRTYITPGTERSIQVLQTSDGGYVVLGSIGAIYPGFYLAKFDLAGNKLWSQHYEGGASSYASAFTQISGGGFIIVGYTSTAGPFLDMYIVKTDDAGDVQLTKTLGDAGNNFARGVVDTGDGYLLAVDDWSVSNGASSELIKIDTTGNEIWRKPLFSGQPAFNGIRSFKVTSDGGYVIAGDYRASSTDFGGAYVARLDSSGDLVWESHFSPSASLPIISGDSVVEAQDGGYMLFGDEASGNGTIVVKTNSAGEQLWAQVYRDINISLSGSVVTNGPDAVIAGSTRNYPVLMSLDADGLVNWRRDLSGGVFYSRLFAAIALAADGGYIVAGSEGYDASMGYESDILLRKTTAQGETFGLSSAGP